MCTASVDCLMPKKYTVNDDSTLQGSAWAL